MTVPVETTLAQDTRELHAKSEVPASYWEILARVGFPMQELRRLGQVRTARSSFDLVVTGVSLAAVPTLYALVPRVVTFAVCFLLSIRAFNCLAQLVHMSDHGALFANPTTNRIFGNLCAYCLGYTRTGHRLTHMDHHRYLNSPRDPDRIWGAPDESTRDLLRRWARDFCFVSALERLLQYSQSDGRAGRGSVWRMLAPSALLPMLVRMLPVIVTQLVILAVYTAIVGPLYYFLLYALPILTFYPAQIRLRSAVEHSFAAGVTSPPELWVSRTTRGKLVERFVLAPLAINYHFEHHLFPAVPHYNLSRLHRLLVRSGFPVPVVTSYVSFVLEKNKAERSMSRPPLTTA
jgi:fatty acid desaturase